jgi:hypothetical protein
VVHFSAMVVHFCAMAFFLQQSSGKRCSVPAGRYGVMKRFGERKLDYKGSMGFIKLLTECLAFTPEMPTRRGWLSF